MMYQFRIPMQHLKLYKMEAIFKALWKSSHANDKSPFLRPTLGYNVPGLLNFKMLVTEYHVL